LIGSPFIFFKAVDNPVLMDYFYEAIYHSTF